VSEGADPLVSIRDLRKTYRLGDEGIEVLKGVDLDIRAGEYVAIMGPSGSGKSTLLNLIGMLDAADAGTYRLGGRLIGTLTADQQAAERNRSIGFVFQFFNLFQQFDVLANIEAPMLYRRVPRRDRRERARELAGRLGLQHRLANRPHQLSGGEQQRVAIARALANDPPLILADEPTGNLDQDTGREVLSIFDDLVARGTTVVMVTHNADHRRRAARVLDMREGRLAGKDGA
jgi:putative ABC transport system ATP-binding protein